MSGSVLHEIGTPSGAVECSRVQLDELRQTLEGVASELGQTLTLTAT
eukprot:COSAG02_NODE_1319_length_13272_cov_10.015714_3_plen_47_part_00